MSSRHSDSSDGPIRITHADAMDPHVDDLLNRQMSLRGESGGMTRPHRRRWYYQNWLVFMVAGALAAAAAWAIIEPSFDDCLYVQGAVELVNTRDRLPDILSVGGEPIWLSSATAGWLQMNGQRIWVLDDTLLLNHDGSSRPFDLSALKKGETIGVHVEYFGLGQDEFSFARFVDRDPPIPSPANSSLELRQLSARSTAMGWLVFPLVAALIGLAIGAADGIVCRLIRRALLGGAVGLLAGFIGGFFSSILAGLIYAPLNALAMRESGSLSTGLSTFGFFVQMCGRSFAWCVAGSAMGLGQGLALRSKRLLVYGLLGGVIGGLLGGLAFDPIDLLLLGMDKPSAHWSRLIGFVCVGASVGAMIGIVELLARDAWLQMTKGSLAGKEFLIFKDSMKVGASPSSDVYLFNDDSVAPLHAVIRAVGENYEIENQCAEQPVCVNGRPVSRTRIRHGDRIGVGQTSFVFQKRRG